MEFSQGLRLVNEKVELGLSFLQTEPLGYIFLDFFVLLVLYRICCSGFSAVKGIRGKKVNQALVSEVENDFKVVKDLFVISKPKVPQVNYGAINVMKKVDGLAERVKEVKEMHSRFQADVCDAHITIFKVLSGEDNFLKPPEREWVDPDSALPPLEENEEGLI